MENETTGLEKGAARPSLKTLKIPVMMEYGKQHFEIRIYKANSHTSRRAVRECARCRRFLGVDMFSVGNICMKCSDSMAHVERLGQGEDVKQLA